MKRFVFFPENEWYPIREDLKRSRRLMFAYINHAHARGVPPAAISPRALSGKRRARATRAHDPRLVFTPDDRKFLFVYPFVKTRAWYALPLEDRKRMMNEHIRVGITYPSVSLNTTYSFGLDDQEFVVAFETDNPADFLDLVQELRETKASSYTLRDTPMFTCRQRALGECLDALG